ncbi:hypothetical protein BD410DRAFT_784933 [Rickenella mellea]|uniref:CST complex subunit STN1 n=1 Tax=Rickenella mellea TaxID=50990 RepID=A0A4Y7QDE5_9AGAM|nr:hypothetical protein BD410DRAFT_784933 [Rickenella mellea]
MSLTTTLTTKTKTRTARSPSKSSSPPKRPRPHTAATPLTSQENNVSQYSSAELYAWTFTQDSIAPCFVKDVYAMKEREQLDQDFFMLGRVPCRMVKIMGLVVGITQKETSTWYAIDDGTGVIECIYRHKKPTKDHPKPKTKNLPAKKEVLYDPPPRPVAPIGCAVTVKGRVTCYRNSRNLNVEHGNIELCLSANDEPRHWLNVINLHRSHYSSLEPFVIPPPTVQLATEQIAESPIRSPSVSSSSPVKSSEKSPPRLRHPSRLHSRDLTDITFRIYLKHYMDNAPLCRPRTLIQCGSASHTSDSDEDDCDDRHATPTPARHRNHFMRTSSTLVDDATPRYNPKDRGNLRDIESDGNAEMEEHGFTLSYLRRVPELADMARRVVHAERKRREREARRKAKADVTNTQNLPSGSAHGNVSGTSKSMETTSRKTKRLFVKTIRDLYAEGSIVIWDGPVRECGDASQLVDDTRSRLWRTAAGDSSSLTASVISTTSSTIGCTTTDGQNSDDDLSEPDPDEEAYLPVTTRGVAKLVVDAIKVLERRRSRKPVSQGHRSTLPSKSSAYLPREPPPTTTRDILMYLRSSDERWGKLGEWVVDAALEELVADETVYSAGDGRWALCI